MKTTWRQARSFDPTVQLLLINQLSINLGFYMLMPYLAAHLSGTLALAAWAVGLIMGMRNLSQQGMFLIGGALADRLGYRPLIIAGCALRTVGFTALAFADTLPALLAASAATGLAGALFNPAVRAYLAAESGERRVEAFALFNVFYQAGILLGPLIGLALTAVAFPVTCLVAAVLFAALTLLQMRRLPARTGATAGEGTTLREQAAVVMRNRPFWLFSAAMTGSYVLSFQIYLALPLETKRLVGDGTTGTAATSALFVISGLVALGGQMRITAWCKKSLTPQHCLVAGLALMAIAFLPPMLTSGQHLTSAGWRTAVIMLPLLACAALLAAATAVLYPFEMDTIVALSGGRWVATHYGLYNTVCGIGITLGNLATGAVLDAARDAGLAALPWVVLALVGACCAAAVAALARSGNLTTTPVPVQV
ncbi:MFS transporter [Streptomyces sp. DT224]|uniref:MFS transporter n=1 Tax=unclassified Streptomyces TaxID=2593676 RepID=UPI0011CE55E5|nr:MULTISPECIES: MFS transporter [unclassified Streptomyces]TXS38264.1 MFS transporter [Streptomyces sp. or43]WRZ03562.1 MFS transporter [Streptomyces sp. NBC_00385]